MKHACWVLRIDNGDFRVDSIVVAFFLIFP